MDYWEYTTVEAEANRKDEIEEVLNELGAHGWQLASVVFQPGTGAPSPLVPPLHAPRYLAFLKRRRE